MNAQLTLTDDDYRPDLSQWFTTSELAERVVAWALDGCDRPLRILEPSAGLGALCRPVPWPSSVVAFDIDPRWTDTLVSIPSVVGVRCGDYLAADPARYDLALMNPPYEGGADCRFVAKALSHCDRVVAILRLVALCGLERHRAIWSRVSVTRMALLARRPSFSGPATGSPVSDFAVIEMINGPGPSSPAMEWWT